MVLLPFEVLRYANDAVKNGREESASRFAKAKQLQELTARKEPMKCVTGVGITAFTARRIGTLFNIF